MTRETTGVRRLLRRMIGFDTVNAALSGRNAPEGDLIAYLADRAEADGFKTSKLPVSGQSTQLLILHRIADDAPWILFDSHVDTVSVEGMTIAPFDAEERDGKIWGRGACDTKGTGAAMYTALCACKDAGTARSNIALLYSVDEESGMSGMRAFTEEHLPELGIDIKGAVVGEPTGLEEVIAHNGVIRFVIRTSGVAAHSADPSKGKSAVSDMARLILYLESEFIPALAATHPLTGRAQSSINVVHGGTAVNIIPALCEAQVDRRLVPGETSQDAERAFAAALDAYGTQYPDASVSYDVLIDTPPLPDDESDWAGAVRDALSAEGLRVQGQGVKYATHAGHLASAGIPSVVFGPGNIAQGHTKDEWIDIDELVRGVDAYRALMEHL